MLERGIALVRIDKNRSLDLFTTGKEIIQKGLYGFRAAPDGSVTAHPSEGGTPGEDLVLITLKQDSFSRQPINSGNQIQIPTKNTQNFCVH